MQLQLARWIEVENAADVTEPYPGLGVFRHPGYTVYPVGENLALCVDGRPVAIVRVESLTWNATGGGESVVQFTQLRRLGDDEAALVAPVIGQA